MGPEQQADAVEAHVGVRELADRRVLRLEGDDQRSWLNGQVTNDVRHTREGQGVYCLAVNVRGKIMADAWMLDRGETLALVVPARSVEALLESFEAQIIMEDVEVEPEEETAVFSLQGPDAERCADEANLPASARVYDCDELGLGGRLVLCSATDRDALASALARSAEAIGGVALEPAGWELARLRAGRGQHGADFDLQHYPQEAGLKERAVSFEKGCYLGQEVVCTLENRGKLRRQLVRLEADGTPSLAAGDPIEGDGPDDVGNITSAAVDPTRGHTLALGYVKSDQARAGNALSSRGHRLRVLGHVGDENV
ncbi:MAG: hypothetical protein OXT09_25450 [Myxococcales bacterium]|nr:hypothetical protein [Myxococcales bacterium]